MKVFVRKNDYQDVSPSYREDVRKIVQYLETVGTVYVRPRTVEDLYSRYSNEEYCAGWLAFDDEILEGFSRWLEAIEL